MNSPVILILIINVKTSQMKKLLILILFIPFISFAQEYSEVVEVSGKSIDQLYASAREWFALTFKSANNVLQMDDPISGILIGKGFENFSESTLEWNLYFTIKVMVKDGKYKCEMFDFFVTTKSSGETLRKDDKLSYFTDQKDFFKNGSDPNWLKKNGAKMAANTAARINATYYSLILDSEKVAPNTFASLKQHMMKKEDDW